MQAIHPASRTSVLFAGALVLGIATSATADVGDVVAVINPQPPSAANFCSIGCGFDGASLYFDRCGDPLIYEISPTDGSLISSFDPMIPELPNALAYDAKRNGLWIGAQGCNGTGMPIYFWDFDDNSVTNEFTIPFGLINPATGSPFLSICFTDGLAYNENDPNTDADDEVWFSDDVTRELGLFRPDGTLVAGYDATTIDPSLSSNSGLAVGGVNLYLGNNGGGDVFRASLPAVVLLDQFASGDDRQEDMECDPITFDPIEVMWVRTTPQGGAFPDVMTAYEIEPNTCGIGGAECFMVIGNQPGNAIFSRDGHTWTTQLSDIREAYPVLIPTVPVFDMPAKPRRGARGKLGFIPVDHFYVQVVMNNADEFPLNPVQWSQGLEVLVWSNGFIQAEPYGGQNGITVWAETFRSNGTPYYRFRFDIDGL